MYVLDYSKPIIVPMFVTTNVHRESFAFNIAHDELTHRELNSVPALVSRDAEGITIKAANHAKSMLMALLLITPIH